MPFRIGILAFMAVGAVLPLIVHGYVLHMLIMVFLFAYLGACWNILAGYAGLTSFGHSLFYGIGGYTSAVLAERFGVSAWLGMGAGVILAALVALGIGHLSCRYGLRGLYFAIVTLFFAESFKVSAQNWAPGGSGGVLIPLLGNAPLYFQFEDKGSYYYIALAMAVLSIVGTRWLERSALGYRLMGLRDDEEAAEAAGINTTKYKLLIIVASGGLTAVGGTFYSQYILFIDPYVAFGDTVTIEMILRPIAGGIGTVWGPLVGSVILTPLPELARYFFAGEKGLHMVAYGLILVAVILLIPQGILGAVAGFQQRRKSKRYAALRDARAL